MKTVNDILKQYLTDNGFDGLTEPDGECACDIKDLAPCDNNCINCIPGYKIPDKTGEFDYRITRVKPKI